MPLPLPNPAPPHDELVLAWGRGPDLPTPPATLASLCEAAARRHADRDAVVWRGQATSYRALDAAAGRLADRLRIRGVGPGTAVGVELPRGPALVTALLAVLKAGAAYVPVDPKLPERRRAFLLDDSGAALCLTDEDLAAPGGAHAPRPARESRVSEVAGQPPASDRAGEPLGAGPGDLAYVIYTSGSTGRPKGVCVEHRSAVDFVVHNAAAYGVGPGTRMLVLASPSFDVSVAEVFTALTSGATLVVADDADGASPDRLQQLLLAERVTVAELPPALLGLLDPHALPELELVSVGGEAPSASEVRRWVRAGHRVVNAYGPTEATVTATLMECDARPRAAVPIGRPMPNQRVYVLDERLELVEPGTPGELFIAGAGVARGYLGRPELTRQRFLDDPFAGRPGARMYRTGDRARWNEDGVLEFLGRVDEQLNVRGQRIEPGEVEACLRAHPGVATAAVAVHEGRLVGYVVGRSPSAGSAGCAASSGSAGADSGGSATESGGAGAHAGGSAAASGGAGAPASAELQAWCRESLPIALVPGAFVCLDALPLTPNGKTDRAALPAQPAGARGPVAAPRSTTEASVLALWEELLPASPIGIDDDFFELGGHSLLAMRLCARLRRRFGAELAPGVLRTARTVAQLARAVEAAAPATTEARAVATPATPPAATGAAAVTCETRLSHSQQRLWLVDRLGTGGGAYNVPVAVRLRGPLAVAALERALGDVVARHEELRASYPAEDGQPVRRVAPPAPVALATTDARGPDECAQVVRREAHAPLSLQDGPLWRARLVRLADDDHVLVLVLHHIACDGWSLSVLLSDLADRYAAHRSGRPAPAAPPAARYADFARRRHEQLTGALLREQLDHWRRTLAGAPPALELPTDRARPPVQSYVAGVRRAQVGAELLARLRARCRADGVTLFVWLLAAYEALLGRLAGTEDLVVACPVAGRPEPDLESVVGCFVDTVPVRGDLSGDPSFAELVRRVDAAVADAMAHQAVPFELVVDALRPARDLSRNPLVQVALNLHSYPAERLELPDLDAEEHPVEPPGSLLDLTLHVREHGGRLQLEAVYCRELFDAERIDELLAQFVHLLEQVTRQPEAPLGACSLRPPRSAAVLPDPDVPLPPGTGPTAVERFARRASEAPARLAIRAAGGELSYGELARRSDRLAAALRRTVAGDLVALVAERDRDLAPRLLGALKAGSVAVLLDGDHPRARRDELLRAIAPSAGQGADGMAALEGLGETGTAPQARSGETGIAPLAQLGEHGTARPRGGEEPDGAAAAPGLDDPAYVLFTSGSTGAPKAVLATHRPLAHFLDWYLDAFAITPDDRFAVLSGLSHDPLLRDLLAPLCAGASAHLPAPDVHRAPGRLLRWLAEEGITVAHLTPQLGRMLAQAAAEAGDGVRLEALRLVAFGGDVLREDDVARWRALAPRATLAGFYGATETPQVMGCELIEGPGAQGSGRAVPLGRGIPGVQLLVRGPGGRPAGVGELGEIWIRTPHLARGYVGDPALTVQRFRDGAYRTGDLGRHRTDGRVEFAGRRDGQVKVRGFRVEPAEVAAALEHLAGVAHAHVRALAEPGGEPRLVACAAGRGLDADDLQRALRAVLPGPMVPDTIVTLAALPLTANGKVDVAALPVPPGRDAQAAAYRPPSTDAERAVAGVWRDVLRLGVVGRDDNFFDLGGNSLRLAQVQARLQGLLRREISMVDLFRYPTIRALSVFLDGGGHDSDTRSPQRVAARRELRARRPRRPRTTPTREE